MAEKVRKSRQTKITTKMRKSWKWKELSTCCWNKARFLIAYCLYCLYMDRKYNKLLKKKNNLLKNCRDIGVVQHWCCILSLKFGGKSQKIGGDISPASFAFRKYVLIIIIIISITIIINNVIIFSVGCTNASKIWKSTGFWKAR